jgi:hypothetical protein
LPNPDFDSDLSGWLNVGSLVQWSSMDRAGDPTSGSAEQPASGAAGTLYDIVSCGPVEVGVEHAYGASVFIPEGTTPGTRAGVLLQWLDGTGCAFGLSGVVGQTSVSLVETTGAWVDVEEKAVAPAGAVSGRLRLRIQDHGGTASGDSVFWDEALLLAAPEPGAAMLHAAALLALVAVRGAARARPHSGAGSDCGRP